MQKFTFDKDFQQDIIALLIRDQQFLKEHGFDIVKPDLFDDWYHQQLCDWVRKYFLSYSIPPTLNALNLEAKKFCEREQFGTDILDNFLVLAQDVCDKDIGSLSYIREEVLSFVTSQAVRNVFEEHKSLMDEGKYEEFAQMIMKAASIKFDRNLGLNFLEHAEQMPQLFRSKLGKEFTIPSGFPLLDLYLKGGYRRGSVYSYVAFTGGLKTWMMCHTAYVALSRGYPVAYFMMEGAEEEVLFRICQMFTQMTSDEINDPANDQIYQGRIKQFLVAKANLFIKHYPNHTHTVQALRSHLSRAKAMHGFDPVIIVVDYADLLLPTTFKDMMYEDYGNIYYELVKLAEEYQAPVITGSQPRHEFLSAEVLGKGCMDKSSIKEQVATACISINRTREEKMTGAFRLFPFKVRNGIEDRVIWGRSNLDIGFLGEDDMMNQLSNGGKGS